MDFEGLNPPALFRAQTETQTMAPQLETGGIIIGTAEEHRRPRRGRPHGFEGLLQFGDVMGKGGKFEFDLRQMRLDYRLPIR